MPAGWADRLKLNTFSGRIDVQVPPTAAGSVEFDTFSGDFSTDVPLTLRSKGKRNVRADFQDGEGTKGTLRLHTFSGDVRVRK